MFRFSFVLETHESRHCSAEKMEASTPMLFPQNQQLPPSILHYGFLDENFQTALQYVCLPFRFISVTVSVETAGRPNFPMQMLLLIPVEICNTRATVTLPGGLN